MARSRLSLYKNENNVKLYLISISTLFLVVCITGQTINDCQLCHGPWTMALFFLFFLSEKDTISFINEGKNYILPQLPGPGFKQALASWKWTFVSKILIIGSSFGSSQVHSPKSEWHRWKMIYVVRIYIWMNIYISQLILSNEKVHYIMSNDTFRIHLQSCGTVVETENFSSKEWYIKTHLSIEKLKDTFKTLEVICKLYVKLKVQTTF